MIAAGIDMGARTVKAVVIDDGRILSHSIVSAGWELLESAQKALEEAAEKAGISRHSIERITVTGIGRKAVTFATSFATESTCDAKGINLVAPSVRTVIDIGAEESRGIRCDASGKVLDFAKNDKCAAGVGSFVESMARALEVKVEEMGELSLKSDKEIPVNVTCVVFAESEIVSLIHARTPKEDIARAIHDAMVTRTVSLVRRVGVEKDVALIGGVACNAGVIDSLKRHLMVDLVVPENPQVVSALGAAVLSLA